MRHHKFIGDKRVIYVEVDDSNNPDYRQLLDEKQKSKVRHGIIDRKIRFITEKTNGNQSQPQFRLTLYGLDGLSKHTQTFFKDFRKIFNLIDKMPMRRIELTEREKKEKTKKVPIRKKISYGLYSDDNPKETIRGTGYKDRQKAIETLKIIKKAKPLRQKQIINTMYNRAKHHRSQTQGMRDAMKVFKKWLDIHSKSVTKDTERW